MPPPIDGAHTLKEIFGGSYLLSIPDYQRGYAWSVDDADQLLGDIMAVLPRAGHAGDQTCYLHSIVLSLKPGPAGRLTATNDNTPVPTSVDVVDGQQRLITLTLLVSCLRDLVEDRALADALDRLITGPKTHGHVLKARGGAGNYLRDHVQPRGATANPVPESALLDQESQTVDAVRTSFRDRLAAMTAPDRALLARVLMERCYLSRVVVSSDDDWRLFVRLNDRGVELSQGDRLKSMLLGQLAPAERSSMLKIWDEQKSALGPDFEGGGARRYLLNYIALLFGAGRGTLVERTLARAVQMGPQRFMLDIFEPASHAYLAITRCRYELGTPEENERIGRYLTYCRWLGEALPTPTSIARDFWLPPVLIGLMTYGRDPQRTLEFLRAFERFAYGLIILHGHDKAAISQIESLSERLMAAAEGEALERMLQPLHPVTIRSNLERSLTGVVAKLVLVRLGAELASGDISALSAHLANDHDIEHVLPQSLKDPWPKLFGGRKGAKSYVELLGNKYVVLIKDNRMLGNLGWTMKRNAFRAMTTLLPLPECVREAEAWNKDAISNRHRRLIEVADRIWGYAATVKTSRHKAATKPNTGPKKSQPVQGPVHPAQLGRKRKGKSKAAAVNRPVNPSGL